MLNRQMPIDTIINISFAILAVLFVSWLIIASRRNRKTDDDFQHVITTVVVSDPRLATYSIDRSGESFIEVQRRCAWEKSGKRCQNVEYGARCSHRTFLRAPRLKGIGCIWSVLGMALRNLIVYQQLKFYVANAHHSVVPKDYGGPAESWNLEHWCHECNIRMGNAISFEGLEVLADRGETIYLERGTAIYEHGVLLVEF